MKKIILTSLLAFAAGQIIAADAKEEVSAAIKKLADKNNYSWTSESRSEGGQGRFGSFNSTGKKDGDIVVIASEAGGNTFEVARKGEKVAIKRDGSWQNPEDFGGGEQGRGFGRAFAQDPVAQAEETLKEVKSLKKEGDAYVGQLTDAGIAALASPFRRGQNAQGPQVSNGSGSVKFWIKDGVLSKMESNVKGRLTFTRDGQSQERDIDTTRSVEFKNVGTTKVELPQEARDKIS